MRFASFVVIAFISACQHDATKAPESPSAEVNALPAPPSGEIRGRIEVAPAVASQVKPGAVIYLIARNAATAGVVAVARLSVPEHFPLEFELTGQNVMIPGQSLSGKLRLSARVDQDGDAMSKSPGDVVGEVSELVDVPRNDVVLTLSETL